MTYLFTKRDKLLKPQEFDALRGTRLSVSTPVLLMLARPNTHEHARLGLAIAKKHAKLSVERNRIKRQVRESFRLNAAAIPALDIVVFNRAKTKELSNQELRSCIDDAWKQLAKKSR